MRKRCAARGEEAHGRAVSVVREKARAPDARSRRARLDMVVFKIVATEEWSEAEAAGVFAGAAVDRADGFIHFSTAEQAPETAAKWFAGRDDLTLAAVDAEALGADLRWEPSRGGALFPHLYAALADERGRLVASAAARTGRAPCFREPRAVRLAKVAGSGSQASAGGDGPSRGDQRAEDRAAGEAAGRPIRGLRSRSWGCGFPIRSGSPPASTRTPRFRAAMLKLGFGFVEVGTLTPRPQDGNARPRLFRLHEDAAVINRFGFNNEGFERAQARLERRPPGVIGVNLGANKDAADRVADYVLGVRTFAALADYLTHQHLLAQHAGLARPAAARGARRSDRARRRRARRDRAAPAAPAQDRARSRRPRARGHRRRGARPVASTASSSPTPRSRGPRR